MMYDKIFSEYKARADGAVGYFLDSLKSTPQTLRDSIAYSLSGGGKRIRPVMFFAAFSLFCDEIPRSAELVAAAIECIHTYSLIHDDLPCMDNDDFRRGRPTNHKVFGEAMAVLAGDALLNAAYELCFDAVILSGYGKNYIKAASQIAACAGKDGLIAGQSLDIGLLSEVKKAEFDYVYRHKTADLFIASVYAGAVCAGADEKQAEKLKEFGFKFGYAFQIQDDLLDEKRKDGEKIVSFVDVFGREYAVKAVEELITDAVKCIRSVDGSDKSKSFLEELALRSVGRVV